MSAPKSLNRKATASVASTVKFAIAAIVALSSVLSSSSGALAQPTVTENISCGVQSALSLAALQKKTVSDEQRKRLIETYPETAISLAAVKNIVQNLGINMVGVKATLNELVTLQQPVIIHLTQSDHFVLMLDGSAENIRLLEAPTAKVSVVPRAEIEPRFDGYALVLPPASARAPSIQFDRTDVSFENIGAAEKIEKEFKFTNVGQQDLTVTVAGTTCGCTAAMIGKKENGAADGAKEAILKPGVSSVVRLSYTVYNGAAVDEAATISTNDPLRPTIHLTLRGTAPQNLQINPSSLFFHGAKGQKSQREITIVGPANMNIAEALVQNPHFEVKVDLVQQERFKKTWLVKVSNDGNSPVGQSSADLEIKSSYAPRPLIKIPVTSNIQSDLQITPPTAFFGFMKKGENKRLAIAVQSATGTPFRLWDLTLPASAGGLKATLDSNQPAAKHTITLEYRSEQAHLMEVTLLLKTDVPSEASLSFPVTALIQE